MLLQRPVIPILLSLLFLVHPARGNTSDPKYKATAPTRQPLQIRLKTIQGSFADSVTSVIPFTRAGNLIMVQARAGEMEGNFILDTGAPYLILNITYFRDVPLLRSATHDKGGIAGEVVAVEKTEVDSFHCHKMSWTKLEADLVNLGHIENNKGVRLLGLLGMELFMQCEMIIDYENNLIYLHRIGKRQAKNYRSEQLKDTSKYYRVPIMIKENKLLVTGQASGRKLLFIIDSGAESNVLDSRLPDKIFEHVAITGRVSVSGSGRGKVDALRGNMSELTVGKQLMKDLPVMITNLEKMCFAYDECLDGMLGFDFLSMRKIGFNFVKREMYIWKE